MQEHMPKPTKLFFMQTCKTEHAMEGENAHEKARHAISRQLEIQQSHKPNRNSEASTKSEEVQHTFATC
jgi:hypothetical protein